MTGYNSKADDPESLIGRRIHVYWAGTGQAYKATITKYTTKDGHHESKCWLGNEESVFSALLLFLFSLEIF